ncbi:ash family protein [Salmonella enterica subsp. enterica serovar Muenchen]|nr:ash family protein [Salmonella enterica subsp. enterica serovar Muenchen]
MVTLAGQPQGWPVPLYAGTANPANVTAPIKICSLGGDSLNLYKEAAMLATTLPLPKNPLFVWRFFSCQQSTYHTVTATSEREARAQLPDAPCLFAARIRVQGVRHV